MGCVMSLVIDILDEMIRSTALDANRIALEYSGNWGNDVGAGIRLSVLQEVRKAVMTAEMKVHEEKDHQP